MELLEFVVALVNNLSRRTIRVCIKVTHYLLVGELGVFMPRPMEYDMFLEYGCPEAWCLPNLAMPTHPAASAAGHVTELQAKRGSTVGIPE